MKIYDAINKKELREVTVYLTVEEASELAQTAVGLATKPEQHHGHVSSADLSQVTLAVYTRDNLSQFDAESQRLLAAEDASVGRRVTSALRRLSEWYAAQCNGDWEHAYGVKIETLDNPGWLVTIDLTGTPLASRSFGATSDGDPESSGPWVDCRKTGSTFTAACSAGDLERVLEGFLDWAGGDESG